jgi:hypothetical protein
MFEWKLSCVKALHTIHHTIFAHHYPLVACIPQQEVDSVQYIGRLQVSISLLTWAQKHHLVFIGAHHHVLGRFWSHLKTYAGIESG